MAVVLSCHQDLSEKPYLGNLSLQLSSYLFRVVFSITLITLFQFSLNEICFVAETEHSVFSVKINDEMLMSEL